VGGGGKQCCCSCNNDGQTPCELLAYAVCGGGVEGMVSVRVSCFFAGVHGVGADGGGWSGSQCCGCCDKNDQMLFEC
jgi:hypothetical protein